MTDSVSIDERAHDIKTAARTKQINACFAEIVRQYIDELTAGEVGEACSYFGEADDATQKKLVSAYHKRDFNELGLIVHGAIGSWIALQASKEVERKIDKGDV